MFSGFYIGFHSKEKKVVRRNPEPGKGQGVIIMTPWERDEVTK